MKITETYTEHLEQTDLSVVKAHYIGDFAIRVSFNNGISKLVDFKPFLEQAKHPIIKKYLDETELSNFQIIDGNLDWNDFELCFPIEDLYRNTISKQEELA